MHVRHLHLVLALAAALALHGCGQADLDAAPVDDGPGNAAGEPEPDRDPPVTAPGTPDPGAEPNAPGNSDPEMDPPRRALKPAAATLHRLTRAQYISTLRALFGPDVVIPADLEPDTPLHGFSTIGASELTISTTAARQFEAAAFEVAAWALADPARRDALVGCVPSGEAADPCLIEFVGRFGRLAWRRPLEGAEVGWLVGLAAEIASDLRDPWQGLSHALAAMLQSPDFLFRIEVGEPDPAKPERRRYTGFEMASRLSYLIWGGPPDAELLDAAAEGRLFEDAGLLAEVDRLLADERARPALMRFFDEALTLDRLATVTKDREAFPFATAALLTAMRSEIVRVVEDIVFDREADLRELLTTRTTFVNPALAALYNLAPPNPASADADGFDRMEHPEDSPRGGLMSMAGILALNAHATVTSPTLRGKFVQTALMCFDVPPPPEGIDTTLAEGDGPQGPQTMRQKLSRHAEDPTCAGCHVHMDPIGLALENFDAIGVYRTTDQGLPIDARSEVGGVAFEGARQLGEVLAAQPQFGECVARRFYRFGTGRLETLGELPAIESLAAAFEHSGYRVTALVRALVLSEAFRTASEPAPLDEPPTDTPPEGDE